MFDLPDLPERPAPPRPLLERINAWLRWVGLGRLVGGSVLVLAVIAGAYWLVRPPVPPVESTLPRATGDPPAPSTSVASTAGAPPSTSNAVVIVHVAGAVVSAGVYELPGGSRVIDAVTAAGGTVADAQADAVNLAALLLDGERVYIPRVGEPVPPVSSPNTVGASAGPLDLNAATEEQLDDLPGVGPATAAAIVAHRNTNGPFSTVDELAEVRGIGPAKLAAIRDLVTV